MLLIEDLLLLKGHYCPSLCCFGLESVPSRAEPWFSSERNILAVWGMALSSVSSMIGSVVLFSFIEQELFEDYSSFDIYVGVYINFWNLSFNYYLYGLRSLSLSIALHEMSYQFLSVLTWDLPYKIKFLYDFLFTQHFLILLISKQFLNLLIWVIL